MTGRDLRLTVNEARAARVRFIVKTIANKWRVYDVVTGSYPYHRPGLGAVKQDVSLDQAQAEAERLNAESA